MTPTDLANIAVLGILAVPVLVIMYAIANAGCSIIEEEDDHE